MHERLTLAVVMLEAAPANAQLSTKADLRWDKMVAEVMSIASRLDGVGMEKVNAMLRAHGLTQTMLRRRMMDLAAAQRGDENVSTPRELTRLLELVAKGDILKPAATQAMVEQLTTGKESYIPRRLPSNVRVANKPGSLDGVRVDAGIVYAAHRPFAIAVMTSMDRDERAAEDVIGQVALASYRFFDIVGRTSAYGRVMP